MNNNEILLTDLFDVDMLQRIQDAFSKMTGFAAIITDAQGKPVTRGSNFTDFCKLFTRNSPIGCLKCEQCDKHGAEIALKVGASVTYYCHAGLIDFAAPIMAGDNMIGCFVGGQVLTEPPDITKIMQVAAELDIELINYLQAALKVHMADKQVVEDAAFFLYTLTDILSSIAYHKYVMHQANIEIEKVANMKSDFLANMSHEIRTPMNAVIGMAEMALREELSPSAEDYISQIRSSGKTLLTIINDILDFSKIESGKMDIIEAEYEPLSMLYDLTNILNTRIKNNNITLILNLTPNLPRTLFGDNIRIKQIITNICNNAIKFTSQGQVVLKVDFVQLGEKEIDLRISVEDTGIGIKKEDFNKLFQSFQQVDSKRNRNIEGTGLGLAISKQLLTLMNGDINVESEYGKGSTFYFHMPQKVIDFSPSVVIDDSNSIPCYGFIQNQYIAAQLENDMQHLNQQYTSISKWSEITDTMNDTDSAYIFIEQSLYKEDIQQFIGSHPNITAVIIVDYNSVDTYSSPNVIIVKKPVSVISIAAIFNHEFNMQDEQSVSSEECYDFTAPDANILLVDDNSINLTVAVGLMKPLEMQIDTATSAKEAIEKLDEKKYDLILMDHMMPDIDGVEATHIIRRFHKDYEKTPIIALTANAVNGVKEMFIAEGMNDFIAKPIEIHLLIKKLKQWLPKEKLDFSKKPVVKKQAETNTLHIGDLDTNAAISMLGTEKLFWSVLKDYFKAIPRKIAVIKEYEDTQDWKNYTVEVHALKSASKQIGATELSQKALELENAGNAKDIKTIHEKTDSMLKQYYGYYNLLFPYFPEEYSADTIDTASKEITRKELEEQFEIMAEAMDNLDMDGMNNVITYLSDFHYPSDAQKCFDHLAQAVDNLDTEECEKIIENWKKILS